MPERTLPPRLHTVASGCRSTGREALPWQSAIATGRALADVVRVRREAIAWRDWFEEEVRLERWSMCDNWKCPYGWRSRPIDGWNARTARPALKRPVVEPAPGWRLRAPRPSTCSAARCWPPRQVDTFGPRTWSRSASVWWRSRRRRGGSLWTMGSNSRGLMDLWTFHHGVQIDFSLHEDSSGYRSGRSTRQQLASWPKSSSSGEKEKDDNHGSLRAAPRLHYSRDGQRAGSYGRHPTARRQGMGARGPGAETAMGLASGTGTVYGLQSGRGLRRGLGG